MNIKIIPFISSSETQTPGLAFFSFLKMWFWKSVMFESFHSKKPLKKCFCPLSCSRIYLISLAISALGEEPEAQIDFLVLTVLTDSLCCGFVASLYQY